MKMKKIIAILMSLMLLLGGLSATAETAAESKVSIGTISINGAFTLQCGLPEGYTIQPVIMDRDQVIAFLKSEDATKPLMVLSVAFDETYSDVDRMNDLSQEDLELLEETYTANDPTVELSYGETGLGTLLLIAKQNNEEEANYIDFLSVYKGYFVEFIMVAGEEAEDKTLTEEQMRICVDFLTDLDFVPADVEAVIAQDLGGKTCAAHIGDYDPEENTLQLTLLTPVVFDGYTVENLQVGDTLTLPEENVLIESIETGDGYIMINDEYDMRINEDGNYTAFLYENQYMQVDMVVDAKVTDNLVFLDDIDPESLEPLDEPTRHTGAEFLEIKAKEAEEMGPGFAVDNVNVTFDEDGNLIQIERIYVPWQ